MSVFKKFFSQRSSRRGEQSKSPILDIYSKLNDEFLSALIQTKINETNELKRKKNLQKFRDVSYKKFCLLIILIFYPELYQKEDTKLIKSMILKDYSILFLNLQSANPEISSIIEEATEKLESSQAGGSKRKTIKNKKSKKTKHRK
jgi:hypothetical protein